VRRDKPGLPRARPDDAAPQQIVIPSPRGGYMLRNSWSTHWHTVLAGAGLPGLDFYELKAPRDPVDGRSGRVRWARPRPADHRRDGSATRTAATWSRPSTPQLAQRRALARAQRAMDAFQKRHVDDRSLHFVGDR